jgi:ABC-type glycerol-3-phosphate transport system permease component
VTASPARIASPGAGHPGAARLGRQTLVVGLTLIGTLVVLIPIVWMFVAAVLPQDLFLRFPPAFDITRITGQYFEQFFASDLYRTYFINSVILGVGTLATSLLLGLPAAYGFSRFRFPGHRLLQVLLLALLVLPEVVVVVPYAGLAHTLHLYDSLLGLIIANTTFTLPIAIWLLKGYIDTVPVEIEEAALIDGCGRLGSLRRVALPLLRPALVGIGAFAFITAWNDYLLALVLTQSPSSQPLTIGLASFFGQFHRDWNSIMALSAIASLPLMVIFVVFQRWVIQGMSRGAVK